MGLYTGGLTRRLKILVVTIFSTCEEKDTGVAKNVADKLKTLVGLTKM